MSPWNAESSQAVMGQPWDKHVEREFSSGQSRCEMFISLVTWDTHTVLTAHGMSLRLTAAPRLGGSPARQAGAPRGGCSAPQDRAEACPAPPGTRRPQASSPRRAEAAALLRLLPQIRAKLGRGNIRNLYSVRTTSSSVSTFPLPKFISEERSAVTPRSLRSQWSHPA